MDASKSKRSAALASILAGAFLTLAKLVVGLMTGSLGILSEAAHSLVDLAAAGLTYFAVRFSDRPADEGHPYGHGKMEALSALIETGLLFLIAFWIVLEAVDRLFLGGGHGIAVEATWYGAGVMIVSIIVDFTRSRALLKVAKKTKSQALEADGLHFSADMGSSAVVLLGLGTVALGFPEGDAIAALMVAGLVAWMGFGMGKRTIAVLLDAAPKGIAEKVRQIAATTPGVVRVEEVRARTVSAAIFVEVKISVARTMSLEQAHLVVEGVSAAIQAELPDAYPVVTADPIALDGETIIDVVAQIAARQGLAIHDVAVRSLSGVRGVSFDVDIDADQNIAQAHAEVTKLEAMIAEQLGPDVEVTSHIDPKRKTVEQGRPVDTALADKLVPAIEAAARSVPKVMGVHAISLLETENEGYVINIHCLFAPDLSVAMVHDATMQVDLLVRNVMKERSVVVIHAEPLGAPAP